MRRALVAAALVAALGAAVVAHAARTARPAPVAAHGDLRGPPVMPDAAALISLRAVARTGAGQAQTLRAAVRRCRGRSGAGRCILLPLGNAAAGAKLSEIVLRGLAARLAAGPCMAMASRLAGLVSTIAYLGTDGVRNLPWPGYTWAAARASARVGTRVIAVADGPWPRHCTGMGTRLRA
jgi:hypothetical protein